MAMDERTPDLRQQITYAEDWLARARRQVDQGEHARGAFTLLLAEAEVQRVRERVMASAVRDPASRPRRSGAGLVVAVALVFVVAALAMLWQAPQWPLSDAASEVAIVVLDTESGAMLRMVQAAPEPVERTVVKPVVLRMAAPLAAAVESRPATAAVAIPVRAVPAVAPAVVPAPAPAAVAPAPPALLSEADLIEMVLAAERSLRRSGGQ